MFIYLTIEGQEQVALGKAPYSWNYILRDELIAYESADTLLAEVTIPLPSRESCMNPVLGMLKARETKIQAEAHAEMMKIRERREQLLALTMSPTTGEAA